MQDIVYVADNLQTGSPPPNKTIVTDANMDTSPEPNIPTKEALTNQSSRSDSGIFSTTGNSTFIQDHMKQSNAHSEGDESDNRSECSSPDRKYYCPICETILTSQHEFTLHIRSHNNETESQDSEKGFICRICSKVLSSSSSLDRHVLVHSGERPFTCKYCGDTFTTNGNMHRHMRTHSHRNESYESDGSTDSGNSTGSKNIEYNNNKIERDKCYNSPKRKMENHEERSLKHSRAESSSPDDESTQNYKCPICSRDDFTSINALDMHLDDNHSDYPTKCSQCNQVFNTNKLLNAHRNTVHASEEKIVKSSVNGFRDLTFIDFSAAKFPVIARFECEKNLHKVTGGLKFQCKKCSRAFPCSLSLEIHEKDCLEFSRSSDSSTDLNKSDKFTESDLRRADFFARLNLQNNSPEKVNLFHQAMDEVPTKLQQRLLQVASKALDPTKDLADIPSILSNASNGSLLQQLQPRMNEVTPATQMNESQHDNGKNENEEESQDVFAAEFRKMKMKGEFPCRLCTAVFPNLRALKGHNRAHLNGNNNGTYRCNMCPHSSADKAALIRHMRSHNGDRPYECSICNYAFTTKANCERHLRNRHGKTTREDVKKSIIYHPSEDPSNDDLTKLVARDETKKLNCSLNSSAEINDIAPEKVRSSTPKEYQNIPTVLPGGNSIKNTTNSLSPTLQTLKETMQMRIPDTHNLSSITDIIRNENLKSLKDHKSARNEQRLHPYLQPQFNFTSKNTIPKLPTKIQVKSLDSLKQMSPYDYDENDYSKDSSDDKDVDEPMDLVLDLSTKKTNSENVPPKVEDKPQDLSKRISERLRTNDILTQELLKNTPKVEPANLYASQLALYPGGLTGWPFPFNPILFQGMQAPMLGQDPMDFKERMQRLQLCGGGMIMDNFAERLKSFHQASLNSANMNYFNNLKMNETKPEMTYPEPNYNAPNPITTEDIKPLSLNIDQSFANNMNKMHSPITQRKSDLLPLPSAGKMVIKNGVLMAKQKQRRYRTERPFCCEHCSARFTLRSNMERHIKQQHPQYWSQRQRSHIGNVGRKNVNNPPPTKNNYCNINIPSYDQPKPQDCEEDTKESQISEKLKYAILSQHLRSAYNNFKSDMKLKEEEEDGDLVIDEKDEKKTENHDKHDENVKVPKSRILEEKLRQINSKLNDSKSSKNEEAQDLVPVARLLDNASQQQFKEYFRRGEEPELEGASDEEEGFVASSCTSEENTSGTDENRSESEHGSVPVSTKKKSAYSLAPNRVSCPYCDRKFPWTSSLRRHVLTHTGQKPFKCSHCPLLFTTKSNCDRHLQRKHGNSATTINNDAVNNNTNYLMRNVPERPFKCSSCPSSTFSTYSNLKKHMSCKHATQSDDGRSRHSGGYEGASSEDEKNAQTDQKRDWENQINQTRTGGNENAQPANSDLPFKCHLCDSSFGERQESLDHIREQHPTEYAALMEKNALDSNTNAPDESGNQDDNDDHEVRGKFPDYANRKVVCAFCMRRFWSAEDLRRHMRTHTGERPFSCDICHRRFTLKHSMLRHRKKHNVTFELDHLNSDEDNNIQVPPAFENFIKGSSGVSKSVDKNEESDGVEGSDLISNLLGIRDQSLIDQVLTGSADNAAKLLGVKSGVQE